MTTRFVQRWVGSLIESHFQLHPISVLEWPCDTLSGSFYDTRLSASELTQLNDYEN
jgi:hypothetical protein